MDDDDLYDEFGNPIGIPYSDAEVDSDDEINDVSNDTSVKEPGQDALRNRDNALTLASSNNNATTSLEDTYGKDVETILVRPNEQVEDAPVLEPNYEKKMKTEFLEKKGDDSSLPGVAYSRDYMVSLMNSLPERVRNIAVVGNLHSGKTTIIDLLVYHTHPSIIQKKMRGSQRPLRYMDTHILEVERGITIKSSPITLLLSDSRERSYVVNVIDTPGHADFGDEVSASLLGADGVLLVIDSVEGVTPKDGRIIEEVLKCNLPIILVLNKLDRLVLELQLSPSDFYFKLKNTIDDVNAFISESEFLVLYTQQKTLSPRKNNVIFAIGDMDINFSLQSFTNLYFDKYMFDSISEEELNVRLWGDIFYDQQNRKFTKSSGQTKNPRSFVHFIANPFYKLFTYTLTDDGTGKRINQLLWENFGTLLHKSVFKSDSRELLKSVLKLVFDPVSAVMDSISECIPNPIESLDTKMCQLFGKPLPGNELVACILKSLESSDGKNFQSLVRVLKGELREGSKVRVFGGNFAEDDEDFKDEVSEEIFLGGGRYRYRVNSVGPGSLVLVTGTNSIVTKSAAIFEPGYSTPMPIRMPNYSEASVLKLAVEAANPSELPKLISSLRAISMSYLASEVKVEESGERIIIGPGELYLDCALHDLRNFFADNLEVKVSPPMTKFSETCIESSVSSIPSKSDDYSISITAEPIMDTRLSHAIEKGKIDLSQPLKYTSKVLRQEFGWDALDSRSVWCFGPDDLKVPSILTDDTLEQETDKKLLYSLKDSISLGFKWSVN